MSYFDFMSAMNKLASCGERKLIRVFKDDDKGRFTALFSDRLIINGREGSLELTANFGDRHTAMFSLDSVA